MPALINSTLNRGSYEVNEDTGAVRDEDNLFVSRTQSITFHGSESELAAAFKAGKANYPGGGESRMLCSGPQKVRLVEATAIDPHYDAEITWMGLHTAYKPTGGQAGWQAIGGTDDFVYRVEDEFARSETLLPIEAKSEDGLTSVWTGAPTPMVPAVINPVTGKLARCRVINFIPSRKVTGVILSTTAVTPFHPSITVMINAWAKIPPDNNSLVQDWSSLGDPLWTYCKGFGAAGILNGGTEGLWIPGSLQVRRQLTAGNLRAFTMDVIWEQRRTPG